MTRAPLDHIPVLREQGTTPKPNHSFWETVAFSVMLGTTLLAMLLLIILGAEHHSRSVTTVECVAAISSQSSVSI